MTALFVIILVEQLEKSKQHLPAFTGFIISIFCLLLFGPNQFLIPSMILITIALFIEKRARKERSLMHAILIILTAAIVTLLIRALPFILFSKHTPDSILYLGKVLPYAIIPMLVVYCLKSVSVLKAPYGIPELIALIVVVCIHKWKHSTLLSILLGTITYMFLIQTVF